MTFAGQIIMKSVSDSTMSDLQIRKNLLKDSEEKTYKGALIQLNARAIVLQLTNLIVTGGTFTGMSTIVPNLQIRLSDMKGANDNMLKHVYTLEKETQEELFKRDVRIDGTYLSSTDENYKDIDIFELTDEVGNAIKALAGLSNPSGPAGYEIGNYLTKNLVNDFLYKSLKFANLLTNTVEQQKESFQYITNLFLILNPFLLTGIGILLTLIIWNQYRIEKENMRAFVKIPSEGVKVVANRFLQFQKNLVNEENFEKKWLSVINKDLQGSQKDYIATSAYSRKAENQKIQYETFKKRYSKYIARVIICISPLVAITLWDLVTTRQAIKVIYNRQGQLQFANYISSRVVAAHLTFVELFFTNGTQIIEHEDAFEGLVNKTRLLKEIQSEVPEKFLEVDGTYNPEVRDIIFENNPECNGFGNYAHWCEVLVAEGQPVNMIVAIASIQSLLELKIQEFLRVDRSEMKNLETAAYWTETPVTYAVVIAEEAHKIANIMDVGITKKISEMQNLKITIIVIFSIGLLFVSVVTWLYILGVIKEVHNDFKKVLQSFPPNLILSSYLLKRFLQQTSGGLLSLKEV